MKIAILAHWHTASTLLAQQLRLCGMEVGNKNTYWHPKTCAPNVEHAIMNGTGDRMLQGLISPGEGNEIINDILQRYNVEAERKNWKCVGIKTTHALHSPNWPVFKAAFKKHWPDARWVITQRHPMGIIHSTNSEGRWSPERIMKSIESCHPAIREYVYEWKAKEFFYPQDWLSGRIAEKVEELGLTWTKEAEELFDEGRIAPNEPRT